MIEKDATWRVYLTEWLVVYTSTQLEVPGREECKAHFEVKYKGRVRDEDWRIRGIWNTRPMPQVLKLRLPNLKGEFKDHGDAMALASELMAGYQDGPCDLVRRGSLEEQELLDYGRKMLPDEE